MKLLKPIDLSCLDYAKLPKLNPKKVKPETRIRGLFISKGYRDYPKKEYIRCKLIRGHKRELRFIMSKETHDLSTSTNPLPKVYYWTQLVQSFSRNQEYLKNIIPVEVGPISEITKKRNQPTEDLKRSFNSEYCRDYLAKEVTRESYYYYIQYLFSEIDCRKLIKYFGFRCCKSETHAPKCELKWLLLKKYCNSVILEDINLLPFEPQPNFYPLPLLGSIVSKNP